MSTFENNIVPAQKLFSSISNWIDEKSYYSGMKILADKYDKQWAKDLRGNHWNSSLFRKLLQIRERIELTDDLLKDSLIGGSTAKTFLYPSLITYLKLTCFDQLGQPSKFMAFNIWLESKESKAERDLALTTNNGEASIVLYNRYQEIYGTKNSFFRFLREVLPEQHRNTLFSKIDIIIDNEFSENKYAKYNIRKSSNLDKENYLYKVRNDYTHNTLGNTRNEAYYSQNTNKLTFRDKLFIKKETHNIYVAHDFEKSLKESVFIGLSEIIKKID